MKLQEIEQECMKLERTTQTIKDERQSLQEEIVEAERQVGSVMVVLMINIALNKIRKTTHRF